MSKFKAAKMQHLGNKFVVMDVGWQVVANRSKANQVLNALVATFGVPAYLYCYDKGRITALGEKQSISSWLSGLHPTQIPWSAWQTQ
ncbi:hypothetical protein [Paenibacillus taichungensis]